MAKHSAPSSGPSEHDVKRYVDTGQKVAATKSKTGGGGKPSVAGHAAKGAGHGASTGAALGTLIEPGVGTAIGAVGGSVVGAGVGAVGGKRAQRQWKRDNRSTARRLLVAEFLVCSLILALSPVTDKHKSDSMATLMKRGSAIAALFLILGLVSTGGRGAAKVATSFGGLVTIVLLVSDRDVFAKLATKFGSNTNTGPAGPPADTGPAPGSGGSNLFPQPGFSFTLPEPSSTSPAVPNRPTVAI